VFNVMPKQSKSEISDQDLDALVAKVLAQSGEAMAASRLQAGLKPTYRGGPDRVQLALARLVANGTAFRWPGSRSGWAARPYEAWLRDRALELLAAAPLTSGELAKRLPAAARVRVPGVLRQLVASGAIHAHPRQGRRRPFSTRPADALAYARPALEALVAGLAKQGLEEAAVREAIARWAWAAPPSGPSSDPGEAILTTMRELNPQVVHGAVVYLPHLRAALRDRFPDKVPFDRAVLALFEQRRVQLQAHSGPSHIKAEERESMIEDGSGSFYMAIGLRV
jgi:hypothetical protein